MRKRICRGTIFRLLFAACLFMAPSCAAVPVVTLLPAAVPALIAGAGTGISYTFTNIAYKTMTFPMDEVEAATLKALGKMSIRVLRIKQRRYYVKIKGETRKHTVYITIENITPTLTRIKVNVKRYLIFKDKTTAFEIIFQTETFLAETVAYGAPGGQGSPCRKNPYTAP